VKEMAVKSKYKAQLWQEVEGLKEPEFLKVIKLIHFFKEEFVEKEANKKRVNKVDVMKYAGLLKDFSPEEEKVFDEATKRRSLFAKRKAAL